MKIRGQRVGEFMRFINENPFCTTSQVIDHFITLSHDEHMREKLKIRKFISRERAVHRYDYKADKLTVHRVIERPRSQAARNLSYLLYHAMSHLLVGGGHTKGPGLVDTAKREDGKMGYILTPAGMGSLGAWIEKQKALEVSQS
jgi:hypothetical protein